VHLHSCLYREEKQPVRTRSLHVLTSFPTHSCLYREEKQPVRTRSLHVLTSFPTPMPSLKNPSLQMPLSVIRGMIGLCTLVIYLQRTVLRRKIRLHKGTDLHIGPYKPHITESKPMRILRISKLLPSVQNSLKRRLNVVIS